MTYIRCLNMMDIHGRRSMRLLAALVPMANNELTGSRPGGERTDMAVLMPVAEERTYRSAVSSE